LRNEISKNKGARSYVLIKGLYMNNVLFEFERKWKNLIESIKNWTMYSYFLRNGEPK
jgi:hypothetical protein